MLFRAALRPRASCNKPYNPCYPEAEVSMSHRPTAVEVSKAFGHFSRQALQEPVTITNHGHANLVLLSRAKYERLRRCDRAVLTFADFTLDDRAAVAASVAPDEARSFDHEVDVEG
jgi:hypothetical protein